jgi:hypothetical protein
MCFPIQGNIFLHGKLLLDLYFLRKGRYHYKEKKRGLKQLKSLENCSFRAGYCYIYVYRVGALGQICAHF